MPSSEGYNYENINVVHNSTNDNTKKFTVDVHANEQIDVHSDNQKRYLKILEPYTPNYRFEDFPTTTLTKEEFYACLDSLQQATAAHALEGFQRNETIRKLEIARLLGHSFEEIDKASKEISNMVKEGYSLREALYKNPLLKDL